VIFQNLTPLLFHSGMIVEDERSDTRTKY